MTIDKSSTIGAARFASDWLCPVPEFDSARWGSMDMALPHGGDERRRDHPRVVAGAVDAEVAMIGIERMQLFEGERAIEHRVGDADERNALFIELARK